MEEYGYGRTVSGRWLITTPALGWLIITQSEANR